MLNELWESLRAVRSRPMDIPAIDRPGLYALFLDDRASLPSLTIGPSGLLYIGMTKSSLKGRNHFNHVDSGFSSPRRTIGALLKQQLELRATPRSARSRPTAFRFAADGEERLTNWIEGNLEYGYVVLDQDLHTIERQLIADLQPPMNLVGWDNPQRQFLRRLRAVCRAEARSLHGGSITR